MHPQVFHRFCFTSTSEDFARLKRDSWSTKAPLVGYTPRCHVGSYGNDFEAFQVLDLQCSFCIILPNKTHFYSIHASLMCLDDVLANWHSQNVLGVLCLVTENYKTSTSFDEVVILTKDASQLWPIEIAPASACRRTVACPTGCRSTRRHGATQPRHSPLNVRHVFLRWENVANLPKMWCVQIVELKKCKIWYKIKYLSRLWLRT